MTARGGRATTIRAILAAALAAAGVLVGLAGAPPAPVAATGQQVGSFVGLGCTATTSSSISRWGSATAPANAVEARFTVIGGGGAGGLDASGDGGRGGAGGVVLGRVPVTPGQVLWAKLGCGGSTSGVVQADGWARGGPGGAPGAGGGGGATALCLGTPVTGCGGGTMLAIAAGGGGGGRGGVAFPLGCSSPAHAGAGGRANLGAAATALGGAARGGGRGDRASRASGGGAGGGGGGGGGQGPTQNPTSVTPDDAGGLAGTGATGATAGQPATAVPGPASATQGWGGAGSSTTTSDAAAGRTGGGGGGGGHAGGGGGAGPTTESSCFGAAVNGGGGGGAGSSWVRSTVTDPALVPVTSGSSGCGGDILAANAGWGGVGGPGCTGSVQVVWTTNRPPAGADASHPVERGVPRTFGLAASDLDGDTPVTCEVLELPRMGTLTGTGCERTYTAGAIGLDGLTYRVRDAAGALSATYTVTFDAWSSQDLPPTSEDQTLTVAPGSLTAITLGGSDPDGQPSTCFVVTQPARGTLSGSGCTRTYRAPTTTGTYTFGYERYDGTRYSPVATITLIVASGGPAPDLAVTSSHPGPFDEGGQGVYTVTVTNVGAGPTTGTVRVVDTLPPGLTFVSTDGWESGRFDCWTQQSGTVVNCDRFEALAPGASAGYTITVQVAVGAMASKNVVTVTTPGDAAAGNDTATDGTAINHRPTAGPVSVETGYGTAAAVALAGADPDGGPLAYAVTPPMHGSLTGTAPQLTYHPAAGFSGEDRFTYTVTDSRGLVSAAATVTVTVVDGGLRGVVTSDTTGARLPGIVVQLEQVGAGPTSWTTTTGADGSYRMSPDVSPGAYRVHFRDPSQDHADEWLDVTVAQGSPVVADAGLAEGAEYTASFGGTGALTVSLYDAAPSGASPYRTITGAVGEATFRGLPAGTYYASVTDPTGKLVTRWSGNQTDRTRAVGRALDPGGTRTEGFAMVAPGSLAGTVVDADGPVEGITVQAYSATTGVFVRSAKTDAQGQYVVRSLPPGPYKVVFRDASGAHPVTWHGGAEVIGSAAAVTMPTGAALTVDAELPLMAVLEGTVTGGWGGTTPLAGAKVTLYRNGAAHGTATVDPTGRYRATGLPAGDYVLLFTATGHRTEYHLDAYRRADATVVVVDAGSVQGIDATLTPT